MDRRRQLQFGAIAASLVLHVALFAWVASRPPSPRVDPPLKERSVIELEIAEVERPRPVPLPQA